MPKTDIKVYVNTKKIKKLPHVPNCIHFLANNVAELFGTGKCKYKSRQYNIKTLIILAGSLETRSATNAVNFDIGCNESNLLKNLTEPPMRIFFDGNDCGCGIDFIIF